MMCNPKFYARAHAYRARRVTIELAILLGVAALLLLAAKVM